MFKTHRNNVNQNFLRTCLLALHYVNAHGDTSIIYSREGVGKISVFVVKTALAALCGGKILDKLRCKFHAFELMWVQWYDAD